MHMVGEGERVDLGTYVSVGVVLVVGESATYPDDQRRLGFVGKCSIHCHGVSYVVSCSCRYEKSKRQNYEAFWRGAGSIGHEWWWEWPRETRC